MSLDVIGENNVTVAFEGSIDFADELHRDLFMGMAMGIAHIVSLVDQHVIQNRAVTVRHLAEFLDELREKLSKMPDGDGTVLDHVLIYKGTNMGNSHRHAHEKIPVELIGKIDGTFKGNRHIVFPDNVQRHSNMLLSILDLYGIHRDTLGDSTGRLPGLV